MPFPVVHKGVTLTEIPGRIAVFFEVGNCQNVCIGCHSPELRENVESHCYPNMTILDIVDYVKDQYKKGANAVVFMGGLNNAGVSIIKLRKLCMELYSMGVDIGIYDGSPDVDLEDIIPIFLDYHVGDGEPDCILKWIKTGSYIIKNGGLDSPTTNQRFYEKIGYMVWEDKTEEYFQKGQNNEENN